MNFQREDRYFVLKYSELEKCFSKNDWNLLAELSQKVDSFRRTVKQKETLRGVFIESDWPEYETVWSMLENRVAKENKKND